ncbi:hypothetical protein [Mesorhizobium sp. 10J20-29]|jgi:hypothetical protein
MNTSFNRFALAIASLTALSAAGPVTAAQFASAPASAGAAIHCTIPNAVSCTVSSQKGVRSVKITANTPQGTINLVNKRYNSCPKSVKVSWDSAFQAASTKIVECGNLGLKIN